jgi:hypothetical protein
MAQIHAKQKAHEVLQQTGDSRDHMDGRSEVDRGRE